MSNYVEQIESGLPLSSVPITERTYDVYMAAVQMLGYNVFETIPEEFKDFRMCLEAVMRCGLCIKNVPFHKFTEEECRKLCNQAASDSRFQSSVCFAIPEQYLTYDMCLDFVKKYGYHPRCFPEKFRTYELSFETVKRFPWNIPAVPVDHLTLELCKEAVERDESLVRFVPKKYVGEF